MPSRQRQCSLSYGLSLSVLSIDIIEDLTQCLKIYDKIIRIITCHLCVKFAGYSTQREDVRVRTNREMFVHTFQATENSVSHFANRMFRYKYKYILSPASEYSFFFSSSYFNLLPIFHYFFTPSTEKPPISTPSRKLYQLSSGPRSSSAMSLSLRCSSTLKNARIPILDLLFAQPSANHALDQLLEYLVDHDVTTQIIRLLFAVKVKKAS